MTRSKKSSSKSKKSSSERPDYWRKRVPEGKKHKGERGLGDLWPEPKKRIQITLTPVALHLLASYAEEFKLSRSEIVEQVLRGQISLPLPSPEKLEPKPK